jgi:hypothetical protein
MYRLSLLYLLWIHFWRLPETEETRRVQTQEHCMRVKMLKPVWIVSVGGLLATGLWPALMAGLILLTFVSFMFLDET